MVTNALGMKNAIIFLFPLFYLTILCLINLKITFYCILSIYIYIYIFKKNIYIMSMYKRFVLDIYYCEHSIYTLLHHFHFETEVNVLRTIG